LQADRRHWCDERQCGNQPDKRRKRVAMRGIGGQEVAV
jgi:hypothetical protein